jgi:hypothetical protein
LAGWGKVAHEPHLHQRAGNRHQEKQHPIPWMP